MERKRESKKRKAAKEKAKADKKAIKDDPQNNEPEQGKLFVIEFNGSIDAKEVSASLREEITAILTCCLQTKTKSWLKLESGRRLWRIATALAASQLERIKQAG